MFAAKYPPTESASRNPVNIFTGTSKYWYVDPFLNSTCSVELSSSYPIDSTLLDVTGIFSIIFPLIISLYQFLDFELSKFQLVHGNLDLPPSLYPTHLDFANLLKIFHHK